MERDPHYPHLFYVEKKDGPFLFHKGEGFVWEKLPVGTRVIYGNPPLPAIADVKSAVENALDHPLGCEPFSALLRPGMKVTIAFDDISLPLPPMQTPDLRQQIIEVLLDRLASAGIEDIHLIAAISLHRRMTPRELRRVLGPRIFHQFFPDRLYNHDAEDKENILYLGKTEKGEEVEINRRAAESDLLIYVNINLVPMDGGHKSVGVGLSTYRTLRAHHTVHTLMHSRSYMDPAHSALHHSCNRIGKVINQHLNVFHIETTLNSDTFPHWLTFLNKREDQYNFWDKINLHFNRKTLDLLPSSVNRWIFSKIYAPYGLTGVYAGRTDPVHAKTLENVYKQQLVPVKSQADIVLIGLPYLGPYNVNSIMNPILVHCLGLGYMFNFYRNKPLVREGGVMIFYHPVEYLFHPIHHPSYIDFFEQVLTQTQNPTEIEKRWEESFAYNPRYIELYRKSYAYHGVHPFYMWYWGCYGRQYCGRVIFVKPKSPEAVQRMGYEVAENLQEALDKAQEVVGRNPQITYFHTPPIFLCEVE